MRRRRTRTAATPGEHSGDRSDGEASIAATEQFECDEEEDDGEEADEGGGGGEGQQQGRAKKRRVATYTLIDIPPALQRELDSFAEWRLKPINRERDGVSVEAVTVAGNKADALRLLGWLKSENATSPEPRRRVWLGAARPGGAGVHGAPARRAAAPTPRARATSSPLRRRALCARRPRRPRAARGRS